MARAAALLSPIAHRNRLLAVLSRDDLALLTPDLQPMPLNVRKSIESANVPIKEIFFVEDGLVSVVARDKSGTRIEAGIIGYEGMTGVAAVLGSDRSPNETFVQIAGSGLRITASKLKKALAASSTMRLTFLTFAQTFMTQIAQTLLANGRAKVNERLARWLLMAQDRMRSDELVLTHEFLAIMLGVRRPGVTVALQELEGLGLIRSLRGLVVIRNRAGLEKVARGFYGVAEGELNRLLRPSERP